MNLEALVSAGSDMFFINEQNAWLNLICSVDKVPIFFKCQLFVFIQKVGWIYGCRHCFCLDERVGPYWVVKYPSLLEVHVPVCKMIRFPQDFSP